MSIPHNTKLQIIITKLREEKIELQKQLAKAKAEIKKLKEKK